MTMVAWSGGGRQLDAPTASWSSARSAGEGFHVRGLVEAVPGGASASAGRVVGGELAVERVVWAA